MVAACGGSGAGGVTSTCDGSALFSFALLGGFVCHGIDDRQVPALPRTSTACAWPSVAAACAWPSVAAARLPMTLAMRLLLPGRHAHGHRCAQQPHQEERAASARAAGGGDLVRAPFVVYTSGLLSLSLP